MPEDILHTKFNGEEFPFGQRLIGLERYIHGDKDHEIADHMRKSFVTLGGDNPNLNWFETFQNTSGSVFSRGKTSGMVLNAQVHRVPSHIVLCKINRGGLELRTRFGNRTLKPGDIYILASKSDFQSIWGPSDMTRITLPLRPKEDLGGTYDGLYFLSRADPIADILATTIHNMEAALREMHAPNADLMVRVASEIVHGFLATARSREEHDVYEMLRSRVRFFVDDNLELADLDIDEIADHAHVSRATLYRAFENAGGVRSFINRIKLDKAKMMLEQGDIHLGRIIDVANACGFSSTEQFGRAFRKQFGVTPSVYARQSATGQNFVL